MLLLIAAAVLGVSARRHAALSSAPHRLGHGAWATVLVSAGGLLAGAVGLAAVLLIAWRIAGRLRRTRDPDQPEHVVEQPAGGLGARLAALAVVVLVVGAAAGAVLLGARLGGDSRGSPPPARPAHPSVPPALPGIRHGMPASPGLVWLLVAGLLVVTAAAVLLAVDRLRRPAQPAADEKTAAGRSHAAVDRPHPGAAPRSAVIA
ncbi:hypothetical protein ABTX35_00700 [Streptomyces sp. NPDC096080]|uniref:hypothetical protein n=1 Tax=Streptomyces sp. NPDC096080 TaxID=3156693 RepID=UPI003333F9EA